MLCGHLRHLHLHLLRHALLQLLTGRDQAVRVHIQQLGVLAQQLCRARDTDDLLRHRRAQHQLKELVAPHGGGFAGHEGHGALGNDAHVTEHVGVSIVTQIVLVQPLQHRSNHVRVDV